MAVCPHCKAPTAQPGSFCVSCGKPMPSEGAAGRRLFRFHQIAASQPGRSPLQQRLDRFVTTAYRTLLFAGILQLVLGSAASAVGLIAPPDVRGFEIISAVIAFNGGAFLGLAWWSQTRPFSATLTGLALFLATWVLDMSADPTMALRTVLIKLVIALFLARAVFAASKHRTLSQLSGSQPGSPDTGSAAQPSTHTSHHQRAAA